MASQAPDGDGGTEHCQNCGRQTPHSVTIELRTATEQDGAPPLSREPYRVAVCRNCGQEGAQPVDAD